MSGQTREEQELDNNGYRCQVSLRWTDFDASGHVNNAAYLTLLEEARDQWLANFGIDREGYVVANIKISYLAEISTQHESVIADISLGKLGDSTIISHETLLGPDGKVFARAEVVSVAWDSEFRRARSLTVSERDAVGTAMTAENNHVEGKGRE